MKYRIVVLMLCLLCSGGCSNPQESQTPKSAPARNDETSAAKGAVETVVAGLTGQTAVHAGKKARSKLTDIASNEQSSLEEAMR